MRLTKTKTRLAGLSLLTASILWSQSRLSDATLEQLLNTQVTSVSKKEQALARSAAAVYVIDRDEISRSAAQTIPDLLRMVPGVEVAQIDANAWAISIRGFNSRYSNKVLVLIDGRAVYNSTFGGVYWEHVDMPLENIERIEVIRGPGATMWGANAVNGVINVITKTAQATKGGLVSQDLGTGLSSQSTARYGGAAGPHGSYRIFGKVSRFEDTESVEGGSNRDGWWRPQPGFRGDWQFSGHDGLTVEGDLFANRGGQSRRSFFVNLPGAARFHEDVDAAGGSLLTRWTHTSNGGAETSVAGYYDSYRRADLGTVEVRKAVDFDLQHHFATGGRHDVVAGAGFRVVHSYVRPAGPIELTSPARTDPLYSAFVQDEIRLADAIWLTAGGRVEHNAYTGFEFEPSVRIAWMPGPRSTLWAAASRAVRQPSSDNTDVRLDLATIPVAPGVVANPILIGNPKFRSEDVRDFEAGYRAQWSHGVSLDATAFLSYFEHLAAIETGAMYIVAGPEGVRLVVPSTFTNGASARDYGGEILLNFRVLPRWRLSPGYSMLHVNADTPPGLTTQTSLSPRHLVQMRSSLGLSRRLEWEQQFVWHPRAPGTTTTGNTRVDTRLKWRASESIELSAVGQNLLQRGYAEFVDLYAIIGGLSERRVFAKVAWTF